MSTPVSEGFKAQILLTLFEHMKLEKRRKAIHEELEQIAKSAASFVGVDLTTHILDVDTLEFIERPASPVKEENGLSQMMIEDARKLHAQPEVQAEQPTPEKKRYPDEF